MRLLSFEATDRASFGVVDGDGVIDLGPRLPDVDDLGALFAADRLGDVAAAAKGAVRDYALDDIRYDRPIRYPEKTICIGVNYTDRNAEYRDGTDLPEYPSIFMRAPGSLVGHKEAIVRPPESEQLDYEGEIAIVIGKGGRRIPEAEAEAHIGGLTCLNEGTIRDWLRHGKFNVTQGKNFERSGGVGPWIVTADEFDSYDNLRVTTRVNGETRQDDTTASLLFPFAYLIAYVSTYTALKPGDVISTGTPTGAGVRFDPPIWLKPGDVVEVEADGIGVLSNSVEDEVV
ncbi:MAG: fumarylacetoacetate hydrolase family protein [Alphaproteobacteria bacterium]|nr:fumarylacetoacetate hydrolase family protein [Alphaproteobacteria bacterium]